MRVKNFAGFMKTRKMNESEEMHGGDEYGMNPDSYEAGMYGANPEEEEEDVEAEEGADGEEEEVTLESLKAMLDDLTARLEKVEGLPDIAKALEEAEGGEEEEGEDVEAAEEGEATPEA
ncbi:hypothetical protein UFOVP699_98 [uncultured Caudovirales phage]|uniref:Uncharacterized protein n=1 Tax=uncultured Caudovirales phage TaxID=2100421 RepID=A0A6J5NQL9_9CAUD|nr:hypothetical protein UFOVP699_98 [uncultured Caudovirales phage]